jgi:hypothetical protein
VPELLSIFLCLGTFSTEARREAARERRALSIMMRAEDVAFLKALSTIKVSPALKELRKVITEEGSATPSGTLGKVGH